MNTWEEMSTWVRDDRQARRAAAHNPQTHKMTTHNQQTHKMTTHDKTPASLRGRGNRVTDPTSQDVAERLEHWPRGILCSGPHHTLSVPSPPPLGLCQAAALCSAQGTLITSLAVD
eukprot:NODE_9752_length_463_cov_1.748792_g8659_i0.p1 GENE.NODE_9752_length_463_cov_1.748792_g8659_i0~~NODE_9752_length_463_cov_1.748792_g8659_i0.p1  ORF type:complete len:125 (-),score=4.38 NODE_9752_length_463_cov_1.748792_g8659_i0:88-435(-)